MYSKTKKVTTIGMLCAFAYIMTLVARIPIVLFLKYDPKDIVIAIGGFIYKRKHTLSGAITGLCCGWGCMVAVMLLWNYLIAPIYMGCSREEIVGLLFTAFLPFNLIKGGLNTAFTMLLYKPVITVLRRKGKDDE